MGELYRYKCNKCGYEEEFRIGGGFFSDHYYKETAELVNNLKNDVINGKYGEQLKNIVGVDLDNFAFLCDDKLMQCYKCRQFSIIRKPEIHYYIRNRSYKLSITFPVSCPKCSYDTIDIPGIKAACPKCEDGETEMVAFGNWD